MVIAQNRGYVKPAIMTLQTSQCVPMAAIAESNFLTLKEIIRKKIPYPLYIRVIEKAKKIM